MAERRRVAGKQTVIHLAAATESVREDQLDHRIPVEGTGELVYPGGRTYEGKLVDGKWVSQRIDRFLVEGRASARL